MIVTRLMEGGRGNREANDLLPSYKDQCRTPPPSSPQHSSAPTTTDQAQHPSSTPQPMSFQEQQPEGDPVDVVPSDVPIVEGLLVFPAKEPSALTSSRTTVRKHMIWALTLLLIVVIVTVTVTLSVVLCNRSSSSSNEEDFFSPDPQTKLTASTGQAGDRFGHSVALDGETLVVGAYLDADVGLDAGAVFVYSRIAGDTSWTELAKLTTSIGGEAEWFGRDVTIEGDTIVAGAYEYDGVGSDRGAAFVFVRQTSSAWTEQAMLNGTSADGDQFGRSVAISGDTVVIGADEADGAVVNSGAVYVYTRTAENSWIEQAKLTASDGSQGDQFGESVAIAGDTIVVGAYKHDEHGPESGAVYVYTRTGSTWTQQAKLTASDAFAGDQFGRSVAIDGDTIVVGADNADGTATDSGAVFVFIRLETGWIQQDKLEEGEAGDNFGFSVAIDGETIVVGSHSANGRDASNSGAVYVYSRTELGTWNKKAKLTANDGDTEDQFGFSVDIAGDTIVVGADLDDDNGDDSGSVYVFDL